MSYPNAFVSLLIGSLTTMGTVVQAETFDSLSKFDNRRGWRMVEAAQVDEHNSKKMRVDGQGGTLISNGEEKQKARYLRTKKQFGDHEIKVEFMIPKGSNSGFYVQGRYEIQVYDSAGKLKFGSGDMGGLYSRIDKSRAKLGKPQSFDGVAPLLNAAKPFGEWNALQIKFRAPRFGAFGEKENNAHFVEVLLNGKVIHKGVDATGPTNSHPLDGEAAKGPLLIQGDHGPIVFRNLTIEERDYSAVKVAQLEGESRIPLGVGGKKMIEFVRLGKDVFTGKGCIECHAYKQDDSSVKIGPNLYGAFKQKADLRKVIDGFEKHETMVKADENFLITALRKPNDHIAAKADGTAYPAVMQAYNAKMLTNNEIRGLYAYFKTLNAKENAGPARQYGSPLLELPYDPDMDPQAVNTYDGTKVYRAFVDNQTTARAIHVGLENGQNFSFDPNSLSIDRIWTGRFLDMREEVNGRGGKLNQIGEDAQLWDPGYRGILQPLTAAGKPFDASILNTIPAQLFGSKESFVERAAKIKGRLLGYQSGRRPVLHYAVEDHKIALKFEVAEDGKFRAEIAGTLGSPIEFTYPSALLTDVTVSGGKLDAKNGVWQVSDLTQPLIWTATPIKAKASRPEKRPAVVVASPFKWSLSTRGEDLISGYTVERANSPVFSNGSVPLFEPLGFDFDSKGDAYVASRSAGIWKIENQTWKPFARGTFEVLGLDVLEDNKVLVCQKPEISEISDTDGDGLADTFTNLSDRFSFVGNYHAYTHGPAVDSKGNVFFNLNLQHARDGGTYNAGGRFMGSFGGLRGWSCKLNKEGNLSPIASGLRSCAGIGFSPEDKLYYTDNQGEYMGTSKVFRIEQGAYFGHPSGLMDRANMSQEKAQSLEKPMLKERAVAAVLLPHGMVASSPGSPEWDTTKGKFGPFSGQMFVGDQTLSNIHRVHLETVDGVEQGSIMPFVDKLPSGAMRLRFSPKGDLWVGQTGRGWASRGGELAALQKVSFTGTVGQTIHRVESRSDGFEVFFTQPIEPSTRDSVADLKVDSWFYVDSSNYGSRRTDQRDELVTEKVWSEDGKSLRLTIKDLAETYKTDHQKGQTARIYRIDLSRTAFAADKSNFHSVAYYTLNRVPVR